MNRYQVTDDSGNVRISSIHAENVESALRVVVERLRDAGMYLKSSSITWDYSRDGDGYPSGDVYFWIDAPKTTDYNDREVYVFLVEFVEFMEVLSWLGAKKTEKSFPLFARLFPRFFRRRRFLSV